MAGRLIHAGGGAAAARSRSTLKPHPRARTADLCRDGQAGRAGALTPLDALQLAALDPGTTGARRGGIGRGGLGGAQRAATARRAPSSGMRVAIADGRVVKAGRPVVKNARLRSLQALPGSAHARPNHRATFRLRQRPNASYDRGARDADSRSLRARPAGEVSAAAVELWSPRAAGVSARRAGLAYTFRQRRRNEKSVESHIDAARRLALAQMANEVFKDSSFGGR